MGIGKQLKCKQCGNKWTHYCGVGFESVKIKGSKKNNTTGDADNIIACPKCESQEFEETSEIFFKILWD